MELLEMKVGAPVLLFETRMVFRGRTEIGARLAQLVRRILAENRARRRRLFAVFSHSG